MEDQYCVHMILPKLKKKKRESSGKKRFENLELIHEKSKSVNSEFFHKFDNLIMISHKVTMNGFMSFMAGEF